MGFYFIVCLFVCFLHLKYTTSACSIYDLAYFYITRDKTDRQPNIWKAAQGLFAQVILLSLPYSYLNDSLLPQLYWPRMESLQWQHSKAELGSERKYCSIFLQTQNIWNKMNMNNFQTWSLTWDTTIWKSGIWGSEKNLDIEKITFKDVEMKFLAMHITNQKISFNIFMVGNVQNIFMAHGLYLIS